MRLSYFEILRFFQQGDLSQFDVPVERQKTFLESLGTPKNDIDRSYKQYLCQNLFVPAWKVWLLNSIAAIAYPAMLIYYLYKGALVGRKESIETIIANKGMGEVVPVKVTTNYKPDSRFWNEGVMLTLSDLPFIGKVMIRGWRHPYFVFKTTIKIGVYSGMIRRRSPKVIIQFGEYSYGSSIQTAYCHRHGVKHIDIMHGEKLYFIRDSFFHYDECYVWDEHYANLFRKLKAEQSQFVVSLPESLHIDSSRYVNQDAYADYKYYLALYTEEQMKGIVKSMAFAKRGGKKIKYRPHPRYSNMEYLRKYVEEDEIELPQNVSILESVSNLEFAVGSYTTVLSQAYFSGKKVVLDDVTFHEQFEKLLDMDYILALKDNLKLSELQ